MSWRERIILFLKGTAIGVADSVPGVSGGTIAMISGIYEQLLIALKSCNPMSLPVLWKQGPKAFWQRIHGDFLLTLLLGIFCSLLLMANTVLYLLANHFMLVMAFFLGLVMASCRALFPEMGRMNLLKSVLFMIGFVLCAATAVLNPAAGSTALPYIFICGAIAICAMILPGISGAFMLILLGVYEYVLDALRSFQIDVILVFAAGCAIGLLSFAHVLSMLFRYQRENAFAFLMGMLSASLIVLWPWRVSNEPGSGLGVMPWTFEQLTLQSPQVVNVLICAAAGFAVIVAFETIVRRRSGL